MASAVTRALVVGGTSGVGYGIACRVAADSSSGTVIISGRNKPAAPLPHANIEFRALDASSMRSIKDYADSLKATAPEPKFDLLVLTQGILTTAGRTETPGEGIDNKMALHFYGRQALIRELEPVLKDDAKVLVVLDSLRGDPAKLNWDDLDLKTTFSVRNAAEHCMAMTDGMMQHWAAQQNGKDKARHFVHAYPGLVQTNLGHQLPWYMRVPLAGLTKVGGRSIEACGDNLVKGLYEVSAADAKEGRFWSDIDASGRSVKGKKVWTEEQRNKVAAHTWGIIDAAMAVPK
ncbi:uncharacterized protein B0I36DRAFT_324769 [Microdochium trichocladiopsis]|uniref:Uncharacterized protein n=1 Tax=Microdochium trichocladiopsis TaxID=1682393 RepID=A0A9P8Y4L7_9PEZI|nr:uncharacterized protein B0I36DRAFT_324769 [Microdochium trichocladiopsis]KAH7028950.1 hypothetical protein B0I36DRAFT_324769 [Microdochium trichocladiopsis]